MKRRRLLWVVPKWPLPPIDGARLASFQLLRSLAQRGEEIDLVAVAGMEEPIESGEAEKSLGVRSAIVIRRGTRAKNIAKKWRGFVTSLLHDPFLPLTMSVFGAPAVRAAMRSLLAGGRGLWDIVVYDGLHPAAHLSRGGLFAPDAGLPLPAVVYRAHNREATIWQRKAERESNHLYRGALSWQASLVHRFERSLLRHCAGVASVSESDLSLLRRDHPGLRGHIVPIGYEFDPPSRAPRDEGLQVMFLGKLDWPPNREGLTWFLREVWPEVAARRRRLKLTIAGAGDPAFMRPYLGHPQIEFLGRVDEVADLYQQSHIAIVPVHYGSGTRVKAIEACRYAVPCLSTTVGVEGLGLVGGMTYIRADSREEWIDQLTKISSNEAQRIGDRAYRYAKQHFETAGCAADFSRLLDAITDMPAPLPRRAAEAGADSP